jgi:hypothetical protein
MPEVLAPLNEPVLFWLDGHYSGEGTGAGAEDSPVIQEVEHILQSRANYRDAIIIDDARCFTGEGGYPILKDFLNTLRERFKAEPRVANDAIFLLPASF